MIQELINKIQDDCWRLEEIHAEPLILILTQDQMRLISTVAFTHIGNGTNDQTNHMFVIFKGYRLKVILDNKVKVPQVYGY